MGQCFWSVSCHVHSPAECKSSLIYLSDYITWNNFITGWIFVKTDIGRNLVKETVQPRQPSFRDNFNGHFTWRRSLQFADTLLKYSTWGLWIWYYSHEEYKQHSKPNIKRLFIKLNSPSLSWILNTIVLFHKLDRNKLYFIK